MLDDGVKVLWTLSFLSGILNKDTQDARTLKDRQKNNTLFIQKRRGAHVCMTRLN